MYEGLKGSLKLLNHLCNENGCSENCPVYNECTKDLWDLLKKDLIQLNIEFEEVDLPD